MLNEIIELSEQSILHELCLQKAALVDRTIEKALETNVPEKVGAVFFSEEILCEVAREVGQLIGHDT